jgi:hypothetical protein
MIAVRLLGLNVSATMRFDEIAEHKELWLSSLRSDFQEQIS